MRLRNRMDIDSLSSFHNSKTLDFSKFKAYIKKKNELNLKIVGFYQRTVLRKLKLGSFMMRQQTEAKMLKTSKRYLGVRMTSLSGLATIVTIQPIKNLMSP